MRGVGRLRVDVHMNSRRKMLSLALWLALTSHAAAQGARAPESYVALGNTCESNIARLDNADVEAGKESVLIAVARLGRGEMSRRYNHRRLHNLRLYLMLVRKRDAKNLVVAEGERVKGAGRVEIYARGELIDVLEFRRGEDLYAGSCNALSPKDKLYYDSRNPDGRGTYCPVNGRCR
jgi:hypothetical protein